MLSIIRKLLTKILDDIDAGNSNITEEEGNHGKKNSGFTHTNFNERLSIVAIGKADSKKQFLNTIVHEAKHVQSHICMYYDIPEDGEDAAYLIGYIVMEMYKIFNKIICQC